MRALDLCISNAVWKASAKGTMKLALENGGMENFWSPGRGVNGSSIVSFLSEPTSNRIPATLHEGDSSIVTVSHKVLRRLAYLPTLVLPGPIRRALNSFPMV